MACLKTLALAVEVNRRWVLAVGAGALLSGIAFYVITVVAVPTTIVFGTEMPVACAYGSSQQACADATVRLVVLKQVQPIAWLIAGVGGVVMAYAALQRPDSLQEGVPALRAEDEPSRSGPFNEVEMTRVRQVKHARMATCGNCNAAVREDAFRCPSCGAEFTDGS
jgi:hypothetical protein